MLDESPNRPVQDTLAQNLRRLRIARHLSLSELARATRISKGTLSGIENGRANPTVETLASLAMALRISVGELLEQRPPEAVRVVRATEDNGAPQRVLDTFAAAGGLTIAELVIAASETRDADAQPAGSRVHVYVLSGKLLTGPVERVTELAAGDYASFPTDIPHLYETTKQPARVLMLREEPK